MKAVKDCRKMANERHPLSFYFQYFRRIIIVSKVKSQHLKDVLTGTCKKGKEYGNSNYFSCYW
ncbi:hypothetical protein SalAn1F4_08270 [Streptococcus alactolyticus]|nr:hypothetical protein SalAn1F4_08270 [Streptococcus alactolyticus]